MTSPCVYILTNKPLGTLYVGVTGDLIRRVWEHKSAVQDGFTKTHHIHTLVYFEQYETMEEAITREKRLKKWRRAWKIDLIEATNPDWHDLFPGLL